MLCRLGQIRVGQIASGLVGTIPTAVTQSLQAPVDLNRLHEASDSTDTTHPAASRSKPEAIFPSALSYGLEKSAGESDDFTALHRAASNHQTCGRRQGLELHAASRFEKEGRRSSRPSEPQAQCLAQDMVKPEAIGKLASVHRSYTFMKRHRPAPYETLYNAMLKAAHDVAGQYRRPVLNVDLSFTNPARVTTGATSCTASDHGRFRDIRILEQLPTTWSITAKFISKLDGAGGENSAGFLNAQELAYLDKINYRASDVEFWVSMILDPNVDKAAATMLNYLLPHSPSDPDCSDEQVRRIPLMVVMMLLKRTFINGDTFQKLLACSWKILRSPPTWTQFQDSQIFVLFMRLVRHATKVAPATLPNITALLIAWTPCHTSSITHKALTRIYNSALVGLTMAAGESPFRASIFQARAQFALVSHMLQTSPPYELSSVGYRSLVKGQLKHQRTSRERIWATLQSRSWPPYPKPRNAMDEDKGFEFAASRAIKTLMYMRQAGYNFPLWEKMVRIYAGWEESGAPTIQTRVVHVSLNAKTTSRELECKAWAARIRTTRDVREAWSQFLRFEQSDLGISTDVYQALFEKIFQESKRAAGQQPDTHDTLPGEMPEVLEPASSPVQKIYLAMEPLSFMDLFYRMTKSTCFISARFLGKLMATSPSVADALEIWKTARNDANCATLLPQIMDGKVGRACSPVGEWQTFQGLITVFTRFPYEDKCAQYFEGPRREELESFIGTTFRITGEQLKLWSEMAFFQALYMVSKTLPKRPLVYTRLMEGLIRMGYQARGSLSLSNAPFVAALAVLSLAKKAHAPVQPRFFANLCHLLEVCGRRARKVLATCHDDSTTTAESMSSTTAKSILTVGGTLLRRSFTTIYCTSLEEGQLAELTPDLEPTLQIPHTIQVAHPLAIQHYIRALAMYQDFEGIHNLAGWCNSHSKALVNIIGQLPRGIEQWDIARVMFRVALEQPARLFWNVPLEQFQGADAILVQSVRTTLEQLDTIGGWASDEDVEQYMTYIRHQSAMRLHKTAMEATQ